MLLPTARSLRMIGSITSVWHFCEGHTMVSVHKLVTLGCPVALVPFYVRLLSISTLLDIGQQAQMHTVRILGLIDRDIFSRHCNSNLHSTLMQTGAL